MKLLIDIPEHIYEHAKEESEDSIDEGEAMRAIANGSPLSKGHGDLIAEKERLIKKDIANIENKVRHVFNQGYEMGVKAYKENMSSRSEIPNTCGDAISRKYILDLIDTKGANLDDDLLTVEQWIQDAPSVNPHPIECGDAISRQEALNAITMAEVRWQAVDNVNKLLSVTAQQKMGRWEQTRYRSIDQTGETYDDGIGFRCSNCANVFKVTSLIRYHFCPNCGAEMEVEE